MSTNKQIIKKVNEQPRVLINALFRDRLSSETLSLGELCVLKLIVFRLSLYLETLNSWNENYTFLFKRGSVKKTRMIYFDAETRETLNNNISTVTEMVANIRNYVGSFGFLN